MTLRHLKIFTEVCNQNSITAAAKRLYVAQPTVSQVIKELENHYGVKLFDRISHKLFLTEAGEKLFFYAGRILALFDEMEETIPNTDETGMLRIGASITVGAHYMPEYVSLFKKERPKADVRIYINSSENVEKKILKNELDFAMIEGSVHSPFIQYRKIMNDRLVVICHPDHPLLSCPSIEAEQLFSEPFLLREKGSGTRESFDIFSNALGFGIIPAWESSSTQALVNGVAKGIGISVLPYRLVKDSLTAGIICSLNSDEINLSRDYYIIYHKNKYLNSLHMAFIDMIIAFNN